MAPLPAVKLAGDFFLPRMLARSDSFPYLCGIKLTKTEMSMKNVLLLLTLILTACSGPRQNGIYQADDGWDIVEDGKTYAYRCESDGLYLYLDWDGRNSYTVAFHHKSQGSAFVQMRFLCKNKDGRYVYVAHYPDINARFYELKEIGFDIDGGREVIYPYQYVKSHFSLLEKYVSR